MEMNTWHGKFPCIHVRLSHNNDSLQPAHIRDDSAKDSYTGTMIGLVTSVVQPNRDSDSTNNDIDSDIDSVIYTDSGSNSKLRWGSTLWAFCH